MSIKINTIVHKGYKLPYMIVFTDTNLSSKSHGTTTFTGNMRYYKKKGFHRAMYFLFQELFNFLPSNNYLVGKSIDFNSERSSLYLIAYLFWYIRREMDYTFTYSNDPKNKMTVERLNIRYNRKGMILKAFLEGIYRCQSHHSNIITKEHLVYIQTIEQYLNGKYQKDTDIKKVLALGYYIRVRSDNIFNDIMTGIT